MRFIKMVNFQLKLYVKNSYFVNLVIISTTTMLLYQYLAHYVHHNYSGQEWLIAGVMGTWASCTTSAGALGFQRWQGTLPYLLNTVIPREKVLLATLSPAAIYGLMAFPLAILESLILGMPINNLGMQLLLGIFLFWCAATVLSYFISLLFLLSRNSMVYEELVLLPILLLSGLLNVPSYITNYVKPIQMLSPLTLPIKLIYHQNIQNSFIIAFLIVVIFFIGISKLLTNFVVKKAFKDGGVDVF